MNKFPCSTCLVKTCCSEYCNDLEKEATTIDIYVVSLKQCPDCGSAINLGTTFNKTSRICFECSKVFRQETFLKKPLSPIHIFRNPMKITPTAFNIKTTHIPPAPIITDITNLDPPTRMEPTMEETHFILYDRLSKLESRYVIQRFNKAVKKEVMKKIKPKRVRKMTLPSWEGKYPDLFIDEIEAAILSYNEPIVVVK